jgi:FlaA1/EpsC-like NDP-sugar epimerase
MISLGLLGAFSAFAYYFSFLLRFEFELRPLELQSLTATLGLVVCVKLLIFWYFRIHEGWARFVTFYDLLALIRAATVALAAIVVIDRIIFPARLIPRSVFLLDWGITVLILGGVRALCRVVSEGSWRLFFPGDRTPALIVGANEAGESLLRTMFRHGHFTYQVVGFVDRDPAWVGRRISGVPVLGTIDQTCQLAQRWGVQEILIAGGTLSGKEVRELVDKSRQMGLTVKVLPSYEQLIAGQVVIRPRPVAIEDLLHRQPVELDLEAIREWIDGQVIMVTGSAGSIGSEICRQLLRFRPACLLAVDRSETGQFFLEQELAPRSGDCELQVLLADVLDRRRMENIFRSFSPTIVFHAAAYKHVPLMELHPGEAVKNIILATRQVADLSAEHGVDSFVLISTDKAVNPTSVMGACKRVAELYVQSLKLRSAGRWVIVRFGNVLDSAGSVVQVFRQQIAAGGPVTVTDPRMTRYFMTIPEAAQLVIEAGVIGRSGEILLLEMGEPVRIVDLAEEMIRLSGLRPGEDIEIVFTGLRPGEKLFEELYAAGENLQPTRHPKILIADRAEGIPVHLLRVLRRLEESADGSPERILALLQEAVPEYRPQRQAIPLGRRTVTARPQAA